MQIKKYSQIVFTLIAFFVLCGFDVQEVPASMGQPTDERSAQDGLPQSKDEMWSKFLKCKVHLDKKNYTYSIDYTPEIKELEGKEITISGFVLPLESEEKFNHFLISKRTPTCFFCPPGEPNEIIEVFTNKKITWEDGLTTVTGKFGFTKGIEANPELGLFFQLKNADVK